MNTKMLKISLLLLFLSLFTNIVKATDSKPELYLMGKRYTQNFRLRWAVSSPELWDVAKRRGFILERFTFTVANSKDSLAFIKQTYKIDAPLSLDSSAWETLATQDDYAALFAQSVYGNDFALNVFGQSQWESIAKDIEETQLRFSMAMLACDRSYTTACMAKMGYEDVSVRYGEKYLYRIYIDTSAAIADTALFYTDMSYFETPVPLQALQAKFADKTVELQWDTEIFKNQFTAYNIERSLDKKNFQKCNRVPIVQARQNSQFPNQIIYVDSLDENEKIYYYRILGVDIFGDQIPITYLAQGAGESKNTQAANIEKAEITEANSLLLSWNFPVSENEKIRRFKLWNKSAMYGDYIVVDTLIPPKIRSKRIPIQNIFSSNYFVLETEGKDGEIQISHTFFYQLPDSTPPSAPINLQYTVDSNGIVNLQWDTVKEADVNGYRIFRANTLHSEYVQLSSDVVPLNNFQDSLSLNTAKSVFYKVVALDYRGNISDFSKAVEVKRPVKNIPSAPVFANCSYENNTVFLSWFNSPEEEIMSYSVYQQKNQEGWHCIYKGGKSLNPQKYKFIEKDSVLISLSGTDAQYAFKVVSLTDTYDTAVVPFFYTVNYKQNQIKPKLTAYPYRDKKCIAVQWNDTQKQTVKNYYLYRKAEDGALRLLQIIDPEASMYIDANLKMNTHYEYCLRVEGHNGRWSEYSDVCKVNY